MFCNMCGKKVENDAARSIGGRITISRYDDTIAEWEIIGDYCSEWCFIKWIENIIDERNKKIQESDEADM